MSSLRGLRLLQALEQYKTQITRWDTVNVLKKVRFVSASDGRLRGRFTVDEGMCNSGDTLHGGFSASLADVCALFGYVCHPKGRIAWTTSLEMQYADKAVLGSTVILETVPLTLSSKGAVMDCLLTAAGGSGSGALIARGTVTLAAGNRDYQRLVANILPFDVYQE